MSKRSGKKFKRKESDFYQTPKAATAPLIPYLQAEGITTFAEPCDGGKHGGHLVRHLESFDLRCVYRGDITTGQDARLLAAEDYNRAQAVITNPPHTRSAMHALITQFVSTGLPVWLLIDSDWMLNLEAVPYLPYCSDIVVIGRIRWIEGTKKHSMDNFGWYRFHAENDWPTRVHNHRERRRTSAAPELREGTR